MQTSWLDAMIVLMLAVSIAFGFYQGLLRQVVLLISMYFATALSGRYSEDLAAMIKTTSSSTSDDMSRLIAFVLMLVALTVALTWLIWRAYGQTRLPEVVLLDNFGGAALGGLIGVFAIALTLMLLGYAQEMPWAEDSLVREALHTGLTKSSLQIAFSTPLPLLKVALGPWVPDGVPILGG